MFNKKNAKQPLIYADIVANYHFVEGKTFGEMQSDIDTIYRAKIDAYGLSDKGYFNDDAEAETEADSQLEKFFERKSQQGKMK